MNIKEFQEKSRRTLNKELTQNEQLSNMCMGLGGEIGEVIDIVKKHLYQGHKLELEKIINECGDVMFYLVNLCNILDINIEDVLIYNHNKLLKRYPTGFEVERSVNRNE